MSRHIKQIALLALCLSIMAPLSGADKHKKYDAPPEPDFEFGGLEGFGNETVGDLDDKTGADELRELLEPGFKEKEELRKYRKHQGVYMFTKLSYDKTTGNDPRVKGAQMMAEFIEDPYIQDLLFEKAVIKYWDSSPSYIGESTAIFMKAGTNVLPRLRETLTSG